MTSPIRPATRSRRWRATTPVSSVSFERSQRGLPRSLIEAAREEVTATNGDRGTHILRGEWAQDSHKSPANRRWTMLGSNQRPPPCRGGALPAELIVREPVTLA